MNKQTGPNKGRNCCFFMTKMLSLKQQFFTDFMQTQLHFSDKLFDHQPRRSPVYRHLPQHPYQLKRWPLSAQSVARDLKGTYFLFDGLYLVYIGQSRNIQKQLQWHKWKGRRFDSFAFLEGAWNVKRAFIKCYRPVQNKKGVA